LNFENYRVHYNNFFLVSLTYKNCTAMWINTLLAIISYSLHLFISQILSIILSHISCLGGSILIVYCICLHNAVLCQYLNSGKMAVHYVIIVHRMHTWTEVTSILDVMSEQWWKVHMWCLWSILSSPSKLVLSQANAPRTHIVQIMWQNFQSNGCS